MNSERPATLAEEQARIDAAREQFLARGGKIRLLDTYQFKPAPERRDWVDPETVLKRKPRGITKRQRAILKQMADSL